MKKIVTHNGKFHTDDVFAVATLKLLIDGEVEVVRTRDKDEIDSADYVVDVGGEHDPAINRFDHHQKGSAGKRENGITYAAFGLVWKEYGEKICDSKEAASLIDTKVVQPIDAPDNAQPVFENTAFENVYPYGVQSMVNVFRPTWKELDYDRLAQFKKLTELAKQLLAREIAVAKDVVEGTKRVEAEYEKTKDKRLIILPEDLPWRGVLTAKPEPLYVVYQKNGTGRWRLKSIQEEGFKDRKPLPEAWAGKRDEELEEITGVEGAIFCHNGRFMVATETKEAAVSLAKLALEA